MKAGNQDISTIDAKIVASFERIVQVTRTLAWKKGTELSLNPVQLQIILFLMQHQNKNHGITTLAKEFNISKASLSDTINSLKNKELIEKKYNSKDDRLFYIQLTERGEEIAVEASSYSNQMTVALQNIKENEKLHFFSVLSQFIYNLHLNKVVEVQRMCQTCAHYYQSEEKQYCKLLDIQISARELQIDCLDHVTEN